MERKAYPNAFNDDGWAFVVLYITLMTKDAPQCTHSLRETLNGLTPACAGRYRVAADNTPTDLLRAMG